MSGGLGTIVVYYVTAALRLYPESDEPELKPMPKSKPKQPHNGMRP